MANPVTHFEVIGQDARKLQDFYGRVFGWRINTDNPIGYGMVSGEGHSGIGGGIWASEQPEGRGVTFYIEVEDLDRTLREVEGSGGRRLMGPDDVPGGPRIAQFADPDGNRIGLTEAGSMPAGEV